MAMQTRIPFVRCAWFAVLAAVLLYGGGAAAAELSVCIDRSNPMAGIDHQLAQAVATRTGETLRVHEYDSDDNDEVNGMADFHKLAGSACELVLGFPLDTDAQPGQLAGLQVTRPYAHTGFVLVTVKSGVAATLAQLPKGSGVAVTYMTPPNLYFADHPGLHPVVELHDDATLAALLAGKASAAMLWDPAVVRYMKDHHAEGSLAVHPLQAPHASFNLVAIYDPRHAAAAAAFDQAIAAMQASGQLQRILGASATAGAAPASRPHVAEAALRRPASSAFTRRKCGAPAAAASSRRIRAPAAATAASASASAPAGNAPALYTQAQAVAGKQKFSDNCALCHGEDLSGLAGPALKGPKFAPVKANFHVGDIFTIVAHNMPATQPGSLPQQDYVEIMAFLLQQNGYPAGNSALSFDEAMQSKVNFIYHGQ